MAGGARRALVPVVDPTIAKLVGGTPVGAVVTVEIGGRVAGMHESVTVTGTLQSFGPYVLTLDDGLVGQHVDLGATAVIAAPVGVVVVTQRPGVGGVYPEFYRQLGIDPSTFAMVVVKTASNFQHFAPIATDVVRADTPGPTQSDIAGLRWTRIPRPMSHSTHSTYGTRSLSRWASAHRRARGGDPSRWRRGSTVPVCGGQLVR